MSVKIIQQRLAAYNCRTEIEEQQALREIMQEVVLAALGRGDFFKHALFQGGTCLRIFYGLNRFSEDMDFILRRPDAGFVLKEHLEHLKDELTAYGYQIEITDRSKTAAAVQKVFIKDDSIGKLIDLRYKKEEGTQAKLRIKMEVDVNPPAESGAALEYLDFPFVSAVAVQDKSSLFAGKIHALLCREYIKGRDWYDFIWYTSQKIEVNEEFLGAALNQFGPWQGQDIKTDKKWIYSQLEKKISTINWKQAVKDVQNFVSPNERTSLELWSKELFLRQLEKWNRKVRQTE